MTDRFHFGPYLSFGLIPYNPYSLFGLTVMESPQSAAASTGSVTALPEVMSYGLPTDSQSMPSLITGRRSPYHPSLAMYQNGLSGIATSHSQIPPARGGSGSTARSMHAMQVSSPDVSPLVPRYSPEVPVLPAFASTRRRRTTDPLGMSPPSSELVTSAALPCTDRRSARASLKRGDDTALSSAASSSSINSNHYRRRKRKASETKPPPNAKDPPMKVSKREVEDTTDANETNNDADNCCICMCEPEPAEKASINACEHFFCFGCIEKWADHENTCPLCKVRFSKIERLIKPPRRKGHAKRSKRVKNRDQRSELTQGIPLQGLFASIENHGFTVVSHVGWEGRNPFTVFGPPGFAPTSRRVLAFGGNPPMAPSAASRRAAAAATTRNVESPIEDSFFSSDDADSDAEEAGLRNFVEQMRNRNAVLDRLAQRTVQHSAFGPFGMPMMRAPVPPPPPPRSYASNMDDIDAGTANNALEIESDSDDDEIEVVAVAPPPPVHL